MPPILSSHMHPLIFAQWPLLLFIVFIQPFIGTRRLNINYIYINSMQFVLISPSPNRKIYSTH